MRIIGAATLSLMVALAAGTALAAMMAGSELRKYCSDLSEQSFAVGTCVGYVLGVEDAGQVSSTEGAKRADGTWEVKAKKRADGTFEETLHGYRWCLPTYATAEQLAAVVEKWLDAHPQKWHLAASGLVANALEDGFPCK